ncbi:MAG: hypothetical protein L7U83_01530, partial [Akkermansiaceae bacterium]|nr:hypothetical protein [Akkermansiaceae bacterium]
MTETILMFALLAFVPAAFGQAPPPGGDILTKDLSLELGQLKSHFKPIFEEFGEHSKTKIEVVAGPEAVEMRNGRVAGKQWIATSGDYRFKLTIEDATGA